MKLKKFFEVNPCIAVAFSGGVDSSYLLCAANDAGCNVHAYYIKSEFQPQFELEEAISIAKMLDVPLTVKPFSVLDDSSIAGNPPERCYLCKTKILEKLWKLAREDGYTVLCDGTNADDNEADRPGMKALSELGVVSPLRDCGLSKTKIRSLSKKAGLPTHDKPAYACLATRIPTGTTITKALLDKIERAETALFNIGFSDFRVRLLPPDTAKIQVTSKQWKKAASQHNEIVKALEQEFDSILLDMKEK